MDEWRKAIIGRMFRSLQNKEFVYRGNEYEKLGSFQQRLQSEFAGATILGSNSPPSDPIKMGEGQCILYSDAVEPFHRDNFFYIPTS